MSNLKKKLKRAYCERQIRKERLYESFLVTKDIKVKREPLTPEEKDAVLTVWGGVVKPITWDEYEVFKAVGKFDPRYLPHEMYLPIVARKLNNYHYTKFYEDKGLLGRLGGCELKFAPCLVRCIDGEYYDSDLHQISCQEAMEICKEQDTLIWKPSRDSSGGRNVKKYKSGGVSEMFTSGVKDFVIQPCIEQHTSMTVFNKTSVNTFRITTLYLNGSVSVQSIVLRIGKEGSVVDNMSSGGVAVKVNDDGSLGEYAMGYTGERFHEFNGVMFKGMGIPNFPDILEKVKKTHEDAFPLCKIIGWDICIDRNGAPIVIEVNSSQPGIFGEQILCGPIFGDRTQEVIDYIKKKEFNYNRAIFRY